MEAEIEISKTKRNEKKDFIDIKWNFCNIEL